MSPKVCPLCLDDQSEVAEYRFGHKRNIMSLHGEGRNEQDAFCVWWESRDSLVYGPTTIGPKAVFTRPSLLEFLTEISKFAACIFIWSSIKKSTVDKIVSYLFRGLPLPFYILGQDSCRKIETSRGKYLTIISGSKEIFLKNLSEALFVGSTLLDQENTILIDDSPEKCVCNYRRNYLFLKTWSPLDSTDDFFMSTLAPWLLQLHRNYSRGQLRDFVNSNWIGVCRNTG
jgi:hypothetical protein